MTTATTSTIQSTLSNIDEDNMEDDDLTEEEEKTDDEDDDSDINHKNNYDNNYIDNGGVTHVTDNNSSQTATVTNNNINNNTNNSDNNNNDNKQQYNNDNDTTNVTESESNVPKISIFGDITESSSSSRRSRRLRPNDSNDTNPIVVVETNDFRHTSPQHMTRSVTNISRSEICHPTTPVLSSTLIGFDDKNTTTTTIPPPTIPPPTIPPPTIPPPTIPRFSDTNVAFSSSNNNNTTTITTTNRNGLAATSAGFPDPKLLSAMISLHNSNNYNSFTNNPLFDHFRTLDTKFKSRNGKTCHHRKCVCIYCEEHYNSIQKDGTTNAEEKKELELVTKKSTNCRHHLKTCVHYQNYLTRTGQQSVLEQTTLGLYIKKKSQRRRKSFATNAFTNNNHNNNNHNNINHNINHNNNNHNNINHSNNASHRPTVSTDPLFSAHEDDDTNGEECFILNDSHDPDSNDDDHNEDDDHMNETTNDDDELNRDPKTLFESILSLASVDTEVHYVAIQRLQETVKELTSMIAAKKRKLEAALWNVTQKRRRNSIESEQQQQQQRRHAGTASILLPLGREDKV